MRILFGYPPRLRSDDGNETVIAPLPYIVEGEAELVVRLRSTMGRSKARWEAGYKARVALNKAPYEPLLRAVVRRFAWCPPDTRDCPSRLGGYPVMDPPTTVIQRGSAVLNWAAEVVRPLEDLDREVFEEIVGFLRSWDAEALDACHGGTQGRLEAYNITPMRLPALSVGSGNRWFFNHLVVGHRGFAYRVLGEIAVAIVVTRKRRPIWVLSPEHPEEPLQLGEDVVWVLTHPLPRGRRDVD